MMAAGWLRQSPLPPLVALLARHEEPMPIDVSVDTPADMSARHLVLSTGHLTPHRHILETKRIRARPLLFMRLVPTPHPDRLEKSNRSSRICGLVTPTLQLLNVKQGAAHG